MLKTNAENVARIVIGQSSQAKYRPKAKEIVEDLRRLGIPRSKIVTVYKYVRPNRMLEMTELWIVPPSGTPASLPVTGTQAASPATPRFSAASND